MEINNTPENINLGSWRELLGYLVVITSVTAIGLYFSEKSTDSSGLEFKVSMGVSAIIAVCYYLILRIQIGRAHV